MQQNVVELKEIRKATVDNTVVMSKLVDGLSRHKNSVYDHEKEN